MKVITEQGKTLSKNLVKAIYKKQNIQKGTKRWEK